MLQRAVRQPKRVVGFGLCGVNLGVGGMSMEASFSELLESKNSSASGYLLTSSLREQKAGSELKLGLIKKQPSLYQAREGVFAICGLHVGLFFFYLFLKKNIK